MRLLKEEPIHLRNSAELAELARQGDEEAYEEMMNRLDDYYNAGDIAGETNMEENLDTYAAETGNNPYKVPFGYNPPNKHGNPVVIHQTPQTPIHADKKLHNWQYKNAGEPMDIAMRLLKGHIHPNEEDGGEPLTPQEYDEFDLKEGYHPDWWPVVDAQQGIIDEELQSEKEKHPSLIHETGHQIPLEELSSDIQDQARFAARREREIMGVPQPGAVEPVDEEIQPLQDEITDSSRTGYPWGYIPAPRYNEKTGFTRSEPMDIAMRILKIDPLSLGAGALGVGALFEYLRRRKENAENEKFQESIRQKLAQPIPDDSFIDREQEFYDRLINPQYYEDDETQTKWVKSEPMDIAMQLLKAYKFHSQFDRRYINEILLPAMGRFRKDPRKMKYASYEPDDRHHWTKRMGSRFHEQGMPEGFENFTPEQVAGVMAELMLRENPNIVELLQQEHKPPHSVLSDKKPSLGFDMFTTDRPKEDNIWGSQHTLSPILTSDRDDGENKLGVKTVISGIGDSSAKDRQTMKVVSDDSLQQGHNNDWAGLDFYDNPTFPFYDKRFFDVDEKSTRAKNTQIIQNIEDWSDIKDIPPATFSSQTYGGTDQNKVRANTYYQRAAQHMLDIDPAIFQGLSNEEKREIEAQKEEQQRQAKEKADVAAQQAFQGNTNPNAQALIDQIFQGGQLKSEPMDIAMRLLKDEWDYVDDNVLPEDDPHYIYPHEQIWHDEADEDLKEKTTALGDYIEGMLPQDKLMFLNQMDNPLMAMGINRDPRNRTDMTDEETEKYINDAIWEMMFDAWQDAQLEMPGGIDYDLGGNRKSGEQGDPIRAHAVHPSQWKKLASEPMDIAMRLLKMPIVSDLPEVRQLDTGPANIHQFQDPITGEIKPLYISPASNPDSENLYAGIVGDNGDRASAKFNTGDGDYASLDGVETQEPYRRRGYMSAIYDAMDEYLQQNKTGRRLVPSSFQSNEGKAFWESRKKSEPMDIAMRLLKAPQYVLQDAHLPHKPFPDLPEGMPPQNVAMFQEHWGGEEGGAPPEGFHEKYNLHPDAKVSMYGIGQNTTQGWKPGTDQMKHIDDVYANQFQNKLPNVSPDATHVIANTGHSYPIGANLLQGSNINDVQQQQEGFPANQARWDRQQPSYEAMQQPQEEIQTGEPMDIAMRLLKDKTHPGYPENMSIKDLVNAGIDYPFNTKKYPQYEDLIDEHIEDYGERPFNPHEPIHYEMADQPLPVNITDNELADFRNKKYKDMLNQMNERSPDGNEPWAKWIADDALPPVEQTSPLRMRSQVLVPAKDADRVDIDALLDMPDETGASMVQSFKDIPFNEETGFTRSEPMDITMRLLKEMRQSTLGEHHPWWPSPHGEADWFHGTSTDHAKNINERGLLPGKRQAGTGRGDYVEEGIVPTEENTLDESVPAAAFISPDLQNANMHSFFTQNALNEQGSAGTKGMVGIRSQGLVEAMKRGDINPLTGKPLEAVPLVDSNPINEDAIGIAGGVPRQYITPVQPGVIHGKTPQQQADFSNPQQPWDTFYQGMPLDWSGYDRYNDESRSMYGQWA